MSVDFLLIYRAKNGDSDAFEIIIRKYYGNIFNYCKYHALDINTAEDITQDVFLTFLKTINHYKHKGKLLNYLYTIARNKCIDEKKKTSNRDLYIEDFSENIFLEFTESDRKIEYLDVKEAVKKLPSDIKDVIILYYFFDRKQKEVAKICGISLELTKYRLRKGKDMIRKYVEGERWKK